MSDFKKGDVIKLKSGGPAMTVSAVGNQIECMYFNIDTKSFNISYFPPETVEIGEYDNYPNDFIAVKSSSYQISN